MGDDKPIMSALHEIALSLSAGIGPVTGRALVNFFGTAEAVFDARPAHLAAFGSLPAKFAASLRSRKSFDRAARELEFIDKFKISAVFFTSDRYPQRLANCQDAPLMLYFKGNVDLNAQKVISIVGTRRATEYGRELTIRLVKELQQNGMLVVSGLAHGIDSIAHRACLSEGLPTVGVVGHGLDRIYPAQNRNLAEKMIENGAVLSEFISGTLPDRENFPRRNRIVAGMADATVIVEAALNGGALITADLANSYDRDVFAYPGKVGDAYSAGCNALIKNSKAHLITSASDLHYVMGWDDQPMLRSTQTLMFSEPPGEQERAVLAAFKDYQELSVDQIAILARVPQSKLAMLLLNLELAGQLVPLPGKRYRLPGL